MYGTAAAVRRRRAELGALVGLLGGRLLATYVSVGCVGKGYCVWLYVYGFYICVKKIYMCVCGCATRHTFVPLVLLIHTLLTFFCLFSFLVLSRLFL